MTARHSDNGLTISSTILHPSLRFPAAEARRCVRTVHRGERATGGAVAIVFTTSRYIHRVNRTYLRHDRPTDVIAFPLRDEAGTEDEIYVNLDYARAQAREYGVSFREETRRLIVHGCLHLLGYRDKNAADRRRMRAREDRYLDLLRRR
jgi:probable rRNA maturation factor